MKTDAELLSIWKRRAMDLDAKLGWIRTELRNADHLTLTKQWRDGALSLLNETDEEFDEFLRASAH